jgi:hypothetical protein
LQGRLFHEVANWVRVLREFLPVRYGVAAGNAMDADGNTSDQIDVLIYDLSTHPSSLRLRRVTFSWPRRSMPLSRSSRR